jgi:hypothetical protein
MPLTCTFSGINGVSVTTLAAEYLGRPQAHSG